MKTQALLCLSLAPGASAHGFLSKPMARNLAAARKVGVAADVGYGLSINSGANDCDVTMSNQMNNNGCQGGVGVIDFQTACYLKCANDLASTAPDCVKCKNAYASKFTADHASDKNNAGGTLRENGHTGVCGDAFWNRANKKDAFALGKIDADSDTTCEGKSCTKLAVESGPSTVSVTSTGTFEVEMTITAHHWGWSEFRLCEHGGYGENDGGLTQECFNEHVLSFDVEDAVERYPPAAMGKGQDGKSAVTSPTDYNAIPGSVRCSGSAVRKEFPWLYSPDGSCCNHGGECGEPEHNAANATRWVFPAPIGATSSGGAAGVTKMHGIYTVMLRMPEAVQCSEEAPCTLQWLFMTGNSPDSYPEAFRNCADIAVVAGAEASALAPPSSPSTVASIVRSKLLELAHHQQVLSTI